MGEKHANGRWDKFAYRLVHEGILKKPIKTGISDMNRLCTCNLLLNHPTFDHAATWLCSAMRCPHPSLFRPILLERLSHYTLNNKVDFSFMQNTSLSYQGAERFSSATSFVIHLFVTDAVGLKKVEFREFDPFVLRNEISRLPDWIENKRAWRKSQHYLLQCSNKRRWLMIASFVFIVCFVHRTWRHHRPVAVRKPKERGSNERISTFSMALK